MNLKTQQPLVGLVGWRGMVGSVLMAFVLAPSLCADRHESGKRIASCRVLQYRQHVLIALERIDLVEGKDHVGTIRALTARYGAELPPGGVLEHTLGAGIELASKLRVDGAAVREVAYQDVAWRMIFALSVRAGRYDVVAARGAGLQGIGGNYRVGLEVDFD